MKSRACLLAALPLVALVAVSQGCSSNAVVAGVPNTNDSGTSMDSAGGGADTGAGEDTGGGTDLDTGTGTPDAGADGDTTKDAAAEASVVQTTPGTSLLNAKDVSIQGATSDGFVLYINTKTVDGGSTSSLEVIGATGAATVIAPVLADTDDFIIDGKAVAYWSDIDPMTGIATGLSVWTAAGGLKAVPTATASLDGIFAASEDGTFIAFSQNVSATDLDLTLGKADGTVVKVIATAGNYDVCGPVVSFAKAILFAQNCIGAAGTTATLVSADSAVADPPVNTIGAAGVPGLFGPSANASKVFWLKAANTEATVSPSGGGAASTIAQTVASGFLNDDGSKIIFRTAGRVLNSAPTTNNPTITQLAPTAFNILGIAPDFGSVIINLTAIDRTTNANIARMDLNITSATTVGTPTALAVGSGVGFSSTSSHYFYMTALPTTGKTPIGTLKAHPVAGGTDKQISMSAIFPTLVDGGSKVVFDTNVQALGQSAVTDIQVGDGAGAGAAVTVVQGADPSFEVRNGKIFYVSPGTGLYVVAVP